MRAVTVVFLLLWGSLAFIAGMFIVDTPLEFIIAVSGALIVALFLTRDTAESRERQARARRREAMNREAARVHLGEKFNTSSRYDVFYDGQPD